MKVFYNAGEQSYAPRHSFFTGRFLPYPDVPGRTRSILAALEADGGFEVQPPAGAVPTDALQAVHDADYLEALAGLCARLKGDEEFFPFNMQPLPLLRQSPYVRVRMGYYALDGATPLVAESHTTALGAAATALAGAEALAAGERAVYSLPRPPGHHAGRRSYAGYCLVNNAALAAVPLLGLGKVAVLDVDYHHGNGTQEIFWERDDVLYVSLHCRPEEAYPYVAGAAEESGAGRGLGCNRNLPLPGGTDWAAYQPALESALETVARFDPAVVVLSLGFDTLGSDPIGSFALAVDDFTPLGRLVAGLGRPTLVVQEGGYDVAALGDCARAFFAGFRPAAGV